MFRSLMAFALSALALGGSFQAHANPVTDLVEGATNPANYFVFGQIKTYYELVDQLDSKRVELELPQRHQQTHAEKIETLEGDIMTAEAQVKALEENIESLEALEEATDQERSRLAQRRLEKNTLAETLTTLQTELEALNNTANAEALPSISSLEKEIQTLEDELSKSQIRIRSYAESFVKKILLAIAIWFVAAMSKWLLTKIFNRLDFYVTPQRKAFILQLIRLGINTLAIIAILLVFFSQLIQALPYFAIFATALAFAMRDVILSVIAWIIIGTKDGYKVGHYLHIGTLWGTVVEINPFNTIVRQGGMSGQTGRLLTFPNKKIFEEFLENWSKLYNFTFLKWDFFLEQGSDIEKAESILLKILETKQAKFKTDIDNRKHLFTKKGLGAEDLKPRIFWEIQANGLLLRGKLLVNFDDFFSIRSAVTREFAIAINKEKNIQLRFVNNLIPNQL